MIYLLSFAVAFAAPGLPSAWPPYIPSDQVPRAVLRASVGFPALAGASLAGHIPLTHDVSTFVEAGAEWPLFGWGATARVGLDYGRWVDRLPVRYSLSAGWRHGVSGLFYDDVHSGPTASASIGHTRWGPAEELGLNVRVSVGAWARTTTPVCESCWFGTTSGTFVEPDVSAAVGLAF